ncbi:MAG: peptide ABC transporter permease, partial [Cutibacterium sp.]|nr:peptide ABC transporter permease [Cutibacterium sp.]
MTDPSNSPSFELNTPSTGPHGTVKGSNADTASTIDNRVRKNDDHPTDGRRLSRRQLVLRRFWRSAGARIGTIGLALVILLALIGPIFANWDYSVADTYAFLTPPDSTHWFGTNQGGFDLFAMTLRG